ncbi:MAG: hypothetical protein BAJATHORv1_70100 [Candidatus Thorarchaeota archaeon]|nr:MAG: hypothetical protein BAJATHORv1_70100 [Candidatus Thorarchaeota archaeon]
MERGFAWHHSKQPRHAQADFEDMFSHNCNSVLIAASEHDLDYWYRSLFMDKLGHQSGVLPGNGTG